MTTKDLVVRRWPRRTAYGLAGLAVLLPTSTASAGWYFANQVVDVRGREYPLEVRAVDDATVTLPRTDDTERNVPWGFTWPAGHARLGALVGADRSTVVRQINTVTRGTLQKGIRGYVSSAVFDGDPLVARGLEFEEVSVPAELGPLPAWLVPGSSSTWVIAAHGRGGSEPRRCGRCLPWPPPGCRRSSRRTATTSAKAHRPAGTGATTWARPNGATSRPRSRTRGPAAPPTSSCTAGRWAARR